MKRLYVRPAHHGRSIGRKLAEAVVATARTRGYRRLRLDTITGKMDAAVKLYRSMGFVEIAPYYDSPVPGTAYMELVL
jgi:putative acetyltransferase